MNEIFELMNYKKLFLTGQLLFAWELMVERKMYISP
jgi:hypothetical protein